MTKEKRNRVWCRTHFFMLPETALKDFKKIKKGGIVALSIMQCDGVGLPPESIIEAKMITPKNFAEFLKDDTEDTIKRMKKAVKEIRKIQAEKFK